MSNALVAMRSLSTPPVPPVTRRTRRSDGFNARQRKIPDPIATRAVSFRLHQLRTYHVRASTRSSTSARCSCCFVPVTPTSDIPRSSIHAIIHKRTVLMRPSDAKPFHEFHLPDLRCHERSHGGNGACPAMRGTLGESRVRLIRGKKLLKLTAPGERDS
jgi:hypothetical protein